MDQPPRPPPDDDASWRYPPPPTDADAAKVGQLAPWWRRAVAYIIDALIIGAPLGVFGAIAGLSEFVREGDSVRFEAEPTLLLLSAVITVLYSALMDGGPRQASVGKMALHIQVCDADTGQSIGPGRAALRRLMYLGLFYALFIPGILNALWPLWDPRKQAWHDKAVRSVVVNAGP